MFDLIFCIDRNGKVYDLTQEQIENSPKYVAYVEHYDPGYATVIREANHEGICCYYDLDPYKINKYRWHKTPRKELYASDKCGVVGLTALDRAPFSGSGETFEPKKKHVDAIVKYVERKVSNYNAQINKN